MAKRYSVVRPSIGGSPGFIPAGGGKARAGRIPKAAEASFSIDLNLAGLRKTRDHQKRVKTLEESGLYEGIDLNLVDPDKVAQLYTKLPSDLADLAKSQHEQKGLRARGSYFQDQADLGSEPPRHFIGSEYERTADRTIGEALPMPPGTQRVEDELGLSGGTDDVISNFMAGRYDAAGKRGGLGEQVPDPKIDPFDRAFPSARTIEDMSRGDTADNLEWFGIEEGFGLKKKIDRDELGKEHGSTTEWYPDGTIKSQTDYDHGEEVSRIEYDRSGNIEKTIGDPFGTGSDKIPEKNLTRAEEDLANFLGIDPSFVTKDMYTSRTQFQKELEKPDKVIDAFKNTKEVTRYDPETNETFVKWIKKGSGKVVGKEVNLGVLDPEKGDFVTTFSDDSGQNIVKIGRDDSVKKWVTIEKDLKEKNWNPQVLLLADFLKDGILEEVYGGRSFKELSAPEQGALMAKAFKDARSPAQYVYSHPEIITPLREFSKEKGKIEQLTELVEAVAKLGSNEGNQGNTLRDKHNRLRKR